MEAKNIFSLFVALIMVGSIVGFTAFYNFPDSGQDPPGNDDIQQPTAIDFIAQGVDATVYELLPSVTVQAETEETDISVVRNSIYAVDGVKRVTDRFELADSTLLGMGYVYIGNISFDPSLTAEQVIERLESETTLQYIEGYKYALVELPGRISMQSVNEDLNLSKEYAFSENISEAIVNLDALLGDSLKVTVRATFVGNDATNIMAFEEQNITGALQSKTLELEAPVSSLEPVLLFNGETSYSSADSLLTLEQDLNSMQGVTAAIVYTSGLEPTVLVSSEETFDEEELASFESFLEGLGAETVNLEPDPLNGKVSFLSETSPADFAEKLDAIKAELQSLEVSATVEEMTGFVSGQAELGSADNKIVSSQIKSLLEFRVSSLELLQPGSIHVEELFDSDLNQSYAVPDSEISSMLFIGHSVNEIAKVEVEYAIARNLLQTAQATEID